MKLNKINIIIAFVLCFISVFFALNNKDITLLLFSLYVVIPFIFKVKPIITLLYMLFGFIALFLGCQLHLYKITSWFDNFSHFIWGMLSGLLAIFILIKLKMFNSKNIIFNCLFIFIFSLASSGIWEITEFAIDNLFNQDMQRSATGVYDTMKDIIVTLFGNIIFILCFFFEYKNKKLLIRYIIDSL